MTEDELREIKERVTHAKYVKEAIHDFWPCEINETIYDVGVKALDDIPALIAEIEELRNWIVEADSAFNADGYISKYPEECLSLVRMCHEGRAAMDRVRTLEIEIKRLKTIVAYHIPGGE